MKLSALRAALRAVKGNPSIQREVSGRMMTLTLQKVAFLNELGSVFERSEETGIEFNADTMMLKDSASPSGDTFADSAYTEDADFDLDIDDEQIDLDLGDDDALDI